jgi:hypothetical protein
MLTLGAAALLWQRHLPHTDLLVGRAVSQLYIDITPTYYSSCYNVKTAAVVDSLATAANTSSTAAPDRILKFSFWLTVTDIETEFLDRGTRYNVHVATAVASSNFYEEIDLKIKRARVRTRDARRKNVPNGRARRRVAQLAAAI